MKIIAIIPARMGSSRFPGKPLAKINGLEMIMHVYNGTKACSLLDDVYVATCDEEIKVCVESYGAKAVMTSDSHERASDRIAEAMIKIEEETKNKIDIVVMVQGDEPMVTPEMIEAAVKPMRDDPGVLVVNLMSQLKSKEELEDKNEIKVVVDRKSDALYFSREPIPTRSRANDDVPMFKQVCIIPFRRDFLITFNELEPTPLEVAESVDMLRVLEHGYNVKMVPSPDDTYSVDTQEDLERVEQLMKQQEQGAAS